MTGLQKRLLTSLMLLTIVSVATRTEATDSFFEELPVGCFITKSDVIPKQQTDAIGKKLGTPLKRLSNTYLQVHGKSIQVNVLEARTSADAKRLHKNISAMKNHPALCLLQGKKVIEFCKAEATTAIKTAYELGLAKKPKQVRYSIIAHVSTIDKADYMAFNKLFNVLLNTNAKNPSKASIVHIERLSNGFSFGKSLALRKQSNQDGVDSYEFTPKPSRIETQPYGAVVYSFGRPHEVFGIPYVVLKASIVCNDTGQTQTDREADRLLLSATPYWPVDDPQVRSLAMKITSGERTRNAKVQAILEWLTPGINIRTDGPTGSRWGVKKVLKQKYGHCWDSSDCFVTLARAAGIPSRQVGGWLYGTSGHIWAEVLIDGRCWQQVDPTGGGKLDCGIYHIPYFTTETGEMPILYLSMPRIAVTETTRMELN